MDIINFAEKAGKFFNKVGDKISDVFTPDTKPQENQDNTVSDGSAISNEAAAVKSAKLKNCDDYSEDVDYLARRMAGDVTITEDLKIEGGSKEDLKLLQATDKDDTINITKGDNGSVNVEINGKTGTFTSEEVSNLIIDAGKGNDTINVASDVRNNLNITGGFGNDKITGGSGSDTIVDNYGSNVIDGGNGNDQIYAQGKASETWYGGLWDKIAGNSDNNVISGGNGNDYIQAGKGDDTIDGGRGYDVIYGLDGNDTIAGGEGNDYIDGGKGDDIISGSQGDDKISGGKGNDTIAGDDGNDVIMGGRGNDIISGDQGDDKIVTSDKYWHKDTISSDDGDTVEINNPSYVPLNVSRFGSDGFTGVVDSDLETMTYMNAGQATLNGIGRTGKIVNISEMVDPNGHQLSIPGLSELNDEGKPSFFGFGSSSIIQYNPSFRQVNSSDAWDKERIPITTLGHELVHAYNAGTGTQDDTWYNEDGTISKDETGTKGTELLAVGIDNPGMPRFNPDGISENDFREDLNLPSRDRY